MYKFSKTSLNNLKGVDERLVEIMTIALSRSQNDFGITEGLRDIETQKRYVAEGKSETMKSYHLIGKAVDVVIYKDKKVTWNLKYYKELNELVQEIAKEKGCKVTWGGNWKSLVDGPHFQIEE